jgi:hypothetical protein
MAATDALPQWDLETIVRRLDERDCSGSFAGVCARVEFFTGRLVVRSDHIDDDARPTREVLDA